MMNKTFAEQRSAKAVARRPAVRLRPPAPGTLIPAPPVRVTPGDQASSVEWLPEPSESAVFDLGVSFLRDAVAHSQEDVARYPESARAHTNLAQAFWQSGNVDAAAAHCSIALEKEPQSYVATLLLARIREIQGRAADAVELYESIHARRPNDPAPLMGLASGAARHGQFEKARAYLQQVIASDPTATVPRFHLGMVFLRLRRMNDAIAQFKEAARTEVRSPILQHALGLAYWAQGALKRAERQFRSALHLLPSYGPAIRSLAHLLIQSGRAQEAAAMLEGHLTAHADNEAIRELLGHALFVREEYRRAIEQLKIAFDLMERDQRVPPEPARVANNIGVCYARLKDVRNAEQWYARSVNLDRMQPEGHRNLARLYLEAGRADRAVLLLEVFRKQRTDDVETAFLLALANGQAGENERAISQLSHLVGQSDSPAAAFTLLGVLLSDEANAPAQAVPILEEGYRRFPKDSMLANNLAYALLLSGKTRQARAVLEEHQEFAAHNVYLLATWGLLYLREGDLEKGLQGYAEAQQVASIQGYKELARLARQKMHLEVARYFVEREDTAAASKEIQLGLAIEGKGAYQRSLLEMKKALPEGPKQ